MTHTDVRLGYVHTHVLRTNSLAVGYAGPSNGQAIGIIWQWLWQRGFFFSKLFNITTFVGFSEKRRREYLPLLGPNSNDRHDMGTWVWCFSWFPFTTSRGGPPGGASAWWINGVPKNIDGTHTFFHGSLGNAARIHAELDWSPGSYCDTSAFCCSSWYDAAREWLLHSDWRFLSANTFVDTATSVAAALSCTDRIFVRPDSPLKPFSGRVLDIADASLAKLDHGFYFDDETLPIVACPIRDVGREWRFVVFRSSVIAGSAYDATSRSAIADQPASDAWNFAQSVASSVPAPADAYVLDVCESNGNLRLLELNPFGGADLYACDADAIVRALSEPASDG